MNTLSALELAQEIRLHHLDVVEVVAEALRRIEADPLHCFISYDRDGALAAAAQIQKRILADETLSPLAGVPVALDDTILLRQQITTAGSRMLHNFRPPFGSTVAAKLQAAGLIIVGKTNVDEFGLSGTGETSWAGPTRHPGNPAKTCGGAAAAVASGLVPLAVSSDTGAARKFASWSRTVFVRPTYGAVSRYGLVAAFSSGEQLGVAAATMADAAALLPLIAGYDPQDGTSLAEASSFFLPENDFLRKSETPTFDWQGLRIGILDGQPGLTSAPAPDRSAPFAAFCNNLRVRGAELSACELLFGQIAHLIQQILSSAETCANLSRFDGVKFGYRTQGYSSLEDLYLKSRSQSFGQEVKQTILFGSYVLSQEQYESHYRQALKVRHLLKDELERAFATYDFLLTPAAVHAPYQLGHRASNNRLSFEDSRLTALATLAGLPAAVFPCGRDRGKNFGGFPFGVQVLAPVGHDGRLTRMLSDYEQWEGGAPLGI